VAIRTAGGGRVGEDGVPADSDTYDYRRAARDAPHFAALFDRFIQIVSGTTATRATEAALGNGDYEVHSAKCRGGRGVVTGF
jgi:hypothetical protein